MTFRALTAIERPYTFKQSANGYEELGCIGYLRADFGSTGKEFYSTWNELMTEFKTAAFTQEFDIVINTLRFAAEYGKVLSCREHLKAYCNANPNSAFNDDRNHYGFRADTEKHTYLFRLNPNKGEYNIYCYCYLKERFDNGIK